MQKYNSKEKTLTILFQLLNQANQESKEVRRLMSENPTRTIYTGGGNYIESNTGTYVQGDYSSMSQDLTQAAAQLQVLIAQLEKRGVAIDIAKEQVAQVAQDIAIQAQKNPKVNDKLIKWGQSLGDATVNDVIKGIVKLAIRSAGIPLP
jgi:hypothetical protein